MAKKRLKSGSCGEDSGSSRRRAGICRSCAACAFGIEHNSNTAAGTTAAANDRVGYHGALVLTLTSDYVENQCSNRLDVCTRLKSAQPAVSNDIEMTFRRRHTRGYIHLFCMKEIDDDFLEKSK